jgi:hypothetical protein
MRCRFACCLVGLTLAIAAVARAGDLPPGARRSDLEFSYSTAGQPPVTGDVIATRSEPFEINSSNVEGEFYLRGTINQQVIRQPDGRLAFYYFLTKGAANAMADGVLLAATGFSGFAVDAAVCVDSTPILIRSADGDRITVLDGGDGPDSEMLLKTDAFAFADGGTATEVIRFQGSAESGPDQSVTMTTYQPVPEPTGLLAFAPAALALLRRCRRT